MNVTSYTGRQLVDSFGARRTAELVRRDSSTRTIVHTAAREMSARDFIAYVTALKDVQVLEEAIFLVSSMQDVDRRLVYRLRSIAPYLRQLDMISGEPRGNFALMYGVCGGAFYALRDAVRMLYLSKFGRSDVDRLCLEMAAIGNFNALYRVYNNLGKVLTASQMQPIQESYWRLLHRAVP